MAEERGLPLEEYHRAGHVKGRRTRCRALDPARLSWRPSACNGGCPQFAVEISNDVVELEAVFHAACLKVV
jgi:hypothetical protein